MFRIAFWYNNLIYNVKPVLCRFVRRWCVGVCVCFYHREALITFHFLLSKQMQTTSLCLNQQFYKSLWAHFCSCSTQKELWRYKTFIINVSLLSWLRLRATSSPPMPSWPHWCAAHAPWTPGTSSCSASETSSSSTRETTPTLVSALRVANFGQLDANSAAFFFSENSECVCVHQICLRSAKRQTNLLRRKETPWTPPGTWPWRPRTSTTISASSACAWYGTPSLFYTPLTDKPEV